MRKILAIVVVLMVLSGAAAAAYVMMRQERQWTTSSPAALEEFEKGLDAEMKLYHLEARDHFRKAVQLDPAFLMARFKLAGGDPSYAGSIREELKTADLSRLTDRERFIVQYFVAMTSRKRDEGVKLLDDYLSRHPRDAVALSLRCESAWAEHDWEPARKCYEGLLKVDPNWVIAQNHLGYIAMAQGRFDEAEELFRTYLFIAPDQANPHDSLGELLTLRGRYAEAEASLREAVRVKPDFCASWSHLATTRTLRGDPAGARAIVEEAKATQRCPPKQFEEILCSVESSAAARGGDWPAVLALATSGQCIGKVGDSTVLAHLAALLTGQREVALSIEKGMRQPSRGRSIDDGKAALNHLTGVRLSMEGDLETAAELLEEADRALIYWGDGTGLFKMYNQIVLSEVYEKLGRKSDAQAMLKRVNDVNPLFAKGVQPMR